MIEVDLVALLRREVAQVAVVCVVGDVGDVLGPYALKDLVRHRRLAGPGSTGHRDHNRSHISPH